MRRKRDNRKRRAFTLVELLVVIVILGLLAGIVAPRFIGIIGRSKRDLTPSYMASIESAIDVFYLHCGDFPITLDDLLNCPPGYENIWAGPYLSPKQLYDPWGNLFVYVREGTVNPGSYDLISYAKDGVAGGTGEGEDIYNE